MTSTFRYALTILLLTAPPIEATAQCVLYPDDLASGLRGGRAIDINNGGVVVGYIWTSSQTRQACYWLGASRFTIPGVTGSDSWADGINKNGQIVGVDRTASGYRGFVYTPGQGTIHLGTLGGADSYAQDVNDAGVVIGYSYLAGNAIQHGFLYRNGSMTDLSLEVGDFSPRGINNRNQIVGVSVVGNVYRGRLVDIDPVRVTDLGSLGGTYTAPNAVNDAGQVVGSASNAAGAYTGFLWQNNQIYGLGLNTYDAYGINNRGQIVGTLRNSYGFMWSDGDTVGLLTLGGRFADAWAINDWGDAVGAAYFSSTTYDATVWHVPGGEGLLLREGPYWSWDKDPLNDHIPGWDHAGIAIDGLVYESHPPYPGMNFWDPHCHVDVPIQAVDGVQAQHTIGSFLHDSPTSGASNVKAFEVLPLPLDMSRVDMRQALESHLGSPFLRICGEVGLPWFSCMRARLSPSVQKGANGSFTCVGLVERCAEDTGYHEHEGFVPSWYEEELGFPLLSPQVLAWCAGGSNPARVMNQQWLQGLLDPVDFLVVDPLGRRMGYTQATGLVNEIPNGHYGGDGEVEEFLIIGTEPGQYQVLLYGKSDSTTVVLSGPAGGRLVSEYLGSGQVDSLTYEMPCVSFRSSLHDFIYQDRDTIKLDAAALGVDPIQYHWRKNGGWLSDGPSPDGGTIVGAATAHLRITGARLHDAGLYDVESSNACGKAMSTTAQVQPAWITSVEVGGEYAFAIRPFRNPIRGVGHLEVNFVLPRADHTRLNIIDVHGRCIATLVDENLSGGPHKAEWPRDVPKPSSGVYFARLTSGRNHATRKLVVVR